MYFTLTSVLPYFEGFKLALFNVIFYPKFSEMERRGVEKTKIYLRQAQVETESKCPHPDSSSVSRSDHLELHLLVLLVHTTVVLP